MDGSWLFNQELLCVLQRINCWIFFIYLCTLEYTLDLWMCGSSSRSPIKGQIDFLLFVLHLSRWTQEKRQENEDWMVLKRALVSIESGL